MLKDSEALELLEAAASEKLFKKLVLQLSKDFEMANVAINNLTGLNHKQLIESLREKIYRLILEDFSDYLNLLYVIDVPEKAFKDLELTDAVEVADQVGYLILKRELLKVRLKDKYSS